MTAQADAAMRVKHDKSSEVRFVLDGRSLTATVVDLPRYQQHPPTMSRVSGKAVVLACGTSFKRFSRATIVRQTIRWSRGARSETVRFRRDISRRVKWCVVDEGPRGGADIASISFYAAEPPRVLVRGRFADGERWRFVAWRGKRLEPCVGVAGLDGRTSTCFHEEAEDETGLAAMLLVPTCSGESVVIGAAARSARTVTVTRSDGSTAAADLYRRPAGSKVRAQYFLTVLTGTAQVTKLVARDAKGRIVGREGSLYGLRTTDCPR
jgi:hypothetical protein